MLFEIYDEREQTLLVDIRDQLGWTRLRRIVAYHLPNAILWVLKEKKEMDIFNNFMVEVIFQLLAGLALMFAYVSIGAINNKIHLTVARMWYDFTEDIQNIILVLVSKAVYIAIIQAVLLITICAIYASAPETIPFFMTFRSSGNQTFKIALPLHHEFLIDKDKYFYLIFTEQFLSLTDFDVLVAGMNFFYCSHLATIIGGFCGLEHLLKKLDDEYSYKILVGDKNANEWFNLQLKDFIRYHQAIIDFYKICNEVSSPIMFFLLIGSGCGIILALTSIVLAMDTAMAATAKMVVGTLMATTLIIFICFPSQLLKNASEDLLLTSYKLNYQNYPPKIRKTFLFIMMRAEKLFVLTAGPLIELNFETCRSILKTSFSYTATFRSVYASNMN
uniref:Odorant receptor n=1 Tax=Trichogramma kaykai TaxID=54128 RepID=A0ABD2WRU9_9HYME